MSAVHPLAPHDPVAEAQTKPSRLWIWVLVVFAVQLAVWTTWIVIAAHHRVEEVPLERGPTNGSVAAPAPPQPGPTSEASLLRHDHGIRRG